MDEAGGRIVCLPFCIQFDGLDIAILLCAERSYDEDHVRLAGQQTGT
jgi:hypothetical protein